MPDSTKLSNPLFSAHSIRGIPPSEIMIPYPSIRSLLESQVSRYGDKTFVVFYSREGNKSELTYHQFFTRVSQAANFLKSRGVEYGDRISILACRNINTLIQYFAVWMGAGVSLPLQGKNKKISHFFIQQSQASSPFPEINSLFIENIRGQNSEFEIGKKSKLDDDVLIVFKENGRTNWRGIVLSHYNVLVDAMAIANWHGLTDDQTVLCGVQLSDVTGIVGCVMSALYAGCRIVLNDENHSESLLDLVDKERVQVVFVDAQQLTELSKSSKDSTEFKLSSLRHFICSHCSLTTRTITDIHQKFGIRVIPGFQMAEATCFSSFLPVSLSDSEFLTWMSTDDGLPVGAALHPTEMAILDPDGQQLPEGKTGQIVFRGHNVMKGYLSDEEASAEVFKFGWLNSGEEGFFQLGNDGNHYFTVTGSRYSMRCLMDG